VRGTGELLYNAHPPDEEPLSFGVIVKLSLWLATAQRVCSMYFTTSIHIVRALGRGAVRGTRIMQQPGYCMS